MGVFGGQPDQADLFTATLDHSRFRQLVRQQRFGRDIGIRHQDGKVDRFHETGKHFGAIVEFVVAHGHAVIAQHVHHLGCHLALVVGVEQRALKLVPAVDQHIVVGARLGVLDRVDQPCGAPETFTGGIVLGGTRAIVFADRFEPRVEIIGVQNGQTIIRRCHARGQRKRCRGCQESFHDGSPLWVELCTYGDPQFAPLSKTI